MKKLQYKKYIEIVETSQQLRFRYDEKIYTKVSDTIRQASAQLEELDYTELYRAYSEGIRKSQVEPRVMFKILVCAYLKGVYSSRKIEELCRENVQFIWLLGSQRFPDHCAIARFRSGKTTQQAIEGLFYQYA
ncbi:MAG: transposase, partial [Ruthenibacterium sp.]